MWGSGGTAAVLTEWDASYPSLRFRKVSVHDRPLHTFLMLVRYAEKLAVEIMNSWKKMTILLQNYQPHSGLRRDFWPEMGQKSVTLSLGTPLCPYPIAYRRAYELSYRWTVFEKAPNSTIIALFRGKRFFTPL